MSLIYSLVAGAAVVIVGAHLVCRWAIRHVSAQPVFVGDLQLPTSYVECVIWGRHEWFIVPQAVNAYGRFWEPGVIRLISDVEHLRLHPAGPQKQWHDGEQDHFADSADAWAIDPCFIPYITDFSRLLLVGGISSCGRIFLDYREDRSEPTVIHWNGLYWQRVAPNCASFLALLEPSMLRRHRNWQPAQPKDPRVAGCITIALEAVARYDIWDTDVLVWLVLSDQGQPTVVLVPDPRCGRWKKAGKRKWRILVSVSPQSIQHTHDGADRLTNGVTITIRGSVPMVDPASPQAGLGRAVAVASRHLASGGPGLAGVICAYCVPGEPHQGLGRYMIDVKAVERGVVYSPMIWVSEDLRQVEIG